MFQMWQDIESFLLAQPTPPQASPVSVCGSGTVALAVPGEPGVADKDETKLTEEPLAEEFVDLDLLINNAAEQHSLQYSLQLQQERALKAEVEQYSLPQQDQQDRTVKLETDTQSLQFNLRQDRQIKIDADQHGIQYTLVQDRQVKMESEQEVVLRQDHNEVME